MRCTLARSIQRQVRRATAPEADQAERRYHERRSGTGPSAEGCIVMQGKVRAEPAPSRACGSASSDGRSAWASRSRRPLHAARSPPPLSLPPPLSHTLQQEPALRSEELTQSERRHHFNCPRAIVRQLPSQPRREPERKTKQTSTARLDAAPAHLDEVGAMRTLDGPYDRSRGIGPILPVEAGHGPRDLPGQVTAPHHPLALKALTQRSTSGDRSRSAVA